MIKYIFQRQANFLGQGAFPTSRNFSTVKEIFHSLGIFPQWRNFSTNKKVFHIKKITWLRKFFTNKKVFCKQKFFLDERSFAQTKVFKHLKKNSASKNQKGCNFSHTQDSKIFHIPKIIRTQKMLLNLFHDTSLFHTPLKTWKIKVFNGVENDHWR